MQINTKQLFHFGLLITFLFLNFFKLNAQLSGKISNEKGEVLPFASIYIKGTTKGTFSNENGSYELTLQPNENIIVCKYIGYTTEETHIFNEGDKLKKNLVLKTRNILLSPVVITPDGEDPAYAIIRKVIRAKEKFQNLPINFKSRIYQKFQFALLEMPEKFMGITIAQSEEDQKEIEELKDTSNNVLVVSEVISDFYRGNKKQFKEVIISSRMSGDQGAYNTMSSEFSQLDFYNNNLHLGRKMESPISTNAFLFYDYKLLGSFIDENGFLINKVEVIPKRRHDPVFSGHLFIVEGIWNLYGLRLSLSSNNTNIMFIDSIHINQQYRVLDRENDEWALGSQFANFNINVLGFRGNGFHTKNIIDYDLNQEFPVDFFDRIVLKVEKESNKRDSIYWEKIRPIPLSIKEKKTYRKMDSISLVKSSRSYLDSMDRKSNRFKINDLLGSYTYRNSYKKYRIEIESPLFKTRFNPVQGFNTRLDMNYSKRLENNKNVKLQCVLDYGFSDKRLNPKLSWKHMLNTKNKLQYNVTIARVLMQPGEQEIMSRFINSLTALIQGKNYIQFYQKDFCQLSVSRHFIPGMDMQFNLQYAKRSEVTNNSSYGFKGSTNYEPNLYEDFEYLKYQNRFNLGIYLSYRPGTKYISLPDRLRILESGKALFYVHYDKSIALNENFVSMDFIKGGMKGSLAAGFFGYSSYHLEGGTFLSSKRVDKIDDHYFPGNDRNYVKNFKNRDAYHLLPYYHSANFKTYGFFKVNHFLNGLILSKIPLIRKLKLEEVINVNVLYLANEKLYYEMGIGINGLFRFANLRYSWGFYGNEFYDKRFTFSFNINL